MSDASSPPSSTRPLMDVVGSSASPEVTNSRVPLSMSFDSSLSSHDIESPLAPKRHSSKDQRGLASSSSSDTLAPSEPLSPPQSPSFVPLLPPSSALSSLHDNSNSNGHHGHGNGRANGHGHGAAAVDFGSDAVVTTPTKRTSTNTRNSTEGSVPTKGLRKADRSADGPESPLPFTNFYQYFMFTWIGPLLQSGGRQALKMEHIFQLRNEDRTSTVMHDWKPLWNSEIETSRSLKRPPKLRRALARQLWKPFVISGILYAMSCATQVASPVMMNQLLTFMKKKNIKENYPQLGSSYWPSDMNEGYYWALGLFGLTLLGALTRSIAMFISNDVLLRIRTILEASLFQKGLRVPAQSRREGDVMSLMTVDSLRLLELASGLHMVWTSPMMVVAGVWLIYNQVGPASLAGFATLLSSFPIASFFVGKQARAQRAAAVESDKRVTVINEFVQGIRVVKYYAWEKAFSDLVDSTRGGELQLTRSYLIYKTLSYLTMISMPLIAALVTFIVFIADGGDMDPGTVFTTLSLFFVIRFPFTILPFSIAAWVQTFISFGRIEKFLAVDDVDSTRIILKDRVGIEIKEASFKWTNDNEKEPFDRLTNINLTIKDKQMVSIIGPVASGKSTLVHGILGELNRTKGSVAVGGNIAYVPQSAFIINASIRDNILFGKPYNAERYAAVISACALKADFAQFDHGDATEIGERGINVSGGQKQRVSIARACYDHESNIVILDDPLSAVDAHVARHIYDHAINGLLANRVRILITHSLQFIHLSDHICLLSETKENKDCYTIEHQGTFDHMMQVDAFVTLMNTFNKGKDDMKASENATPSLAISTSMDSLHGHDDGAPSSPSSSSSSLQPATAAATAPSVEIMTEAETQVASTVKTKWRPTKHFSHAALENPNERSDKGKSRQKLVEQEESGEGTIDASVLKYYYGGQSWAFYIITAIFYFTAITALIGGDFWMVHWTNRVQTSIFTGVKDTHQPIYYLLIYGAILIASNIFLFTRSLAIINLAISSSTKIHRDLFVNIMRKTMSWYERTPVGRVINRFTKDMFILDQRMGPLSESSSSTWFMVFGTFVVLAIVIPPALVVLAILAIAYYFIQKFYRKSSRELQRMEAITCTPVFSHFAEALQGCVTIRAYGKPLSQYEYDNMIRIDTNQRCWLLAQAASFWMRIRLDLMGALLMVATAILAIGSSSLNISINASQLGLMMVHVINLPSIINWAIVLTTELESNFNSVERVRHYTTKDEHEHWNPSDHSKQVATLTPDWPTAGRVELRGYAVKYRPDLPFVLDNINVIFPSKSRIGIVGRTGSGKSTMLLCLFRILEATHGSILIDDIDISELSLTDLRSRLSIIPQDPVLFAGTLRYNLDPFNQFSDTEVWQALEYVQLKDVINRMTNKLSTVTSEAGKDLSLGQRQLMCLARAMLRKPRVICLDEATANVDIQTDTIIQTIIREKFTNSTVITIAHRLNTIMDYDYVLVLEKGFVAEFDNPTVLKNRAGSQFGEMVASHTAKVAAAAANASH